MIVPPGATSVSLTVQIVDDSGLPVTALVAATWPTTYYQRAGESLPAAITLSDLAAQNSAYSSGGVKELTGGYYRLDVPDAAFATAARVRVIGEATGKHVLYPVVTCAKLAATVATGDGVDAAAAAARVATALPNAAPAGSGGLPLLGTTNTAGLTIGVSSGNALTLSTTAIAGHAVSATAGTAGDALHLVGGSSGKAVSASGGTGVTATGTNGRGLDVTGSQGAYFTGQSGPGITSQGGGNNPGALMAGGTGGAGGHGIDFQKGHVNADDFHLATPDAPTLQAVILTAGSITATVAPNLDAAVSSVKAKTDNLPATPAAAGDAMTLTAGERATLAGDTAPAVWDLATAGHTATGSFGAAVQAAGSAGDPWATSLPGSYGAGTAGNVVGTRLDASVSAVKSKTDNLPASPAATGAAMALTAAERAAVADRVLGRTVAGGADGGRTVAYYLQGGMNRTTRSATTLTVYSSDDTTVLATIPIGQDAALLPVASADPP